MIKTLIFVFSLLMPISALANNFTPENVWFCKGVGNIDARPVIVLTDIWSDSHKNDYEKRQAHFAHFIAGLTQGKFRPSFVAKCRDYTDAKRAYKHRQLEIKLAKRYNFDVIETKWSYTPNEKSQHKKRP